MLLGIGGADLREGRIGNPMGVRRVAVAVVQHAHAQSRTRKPPPELVIAELSDFHDATGFGPGTLVTKPSCSKRSSACRISVMNESSTAVPV